MLAALASLLPSNTAHAIRHAFDCMEVCEREIKRARLTKERGSEVFRNACPTNPLRGKSTDLYRAHVRELIARAKRGADLRPATDAELLALFCDTSLTAPLHRNAQAAAELLWSRVFPTGQMLPDGATPESWPNGARDEIEKARKKFGLNQRSL